MNITLTREEAQQLLEVFELFLEEAEDVTTLENNLIKMLRARLAQPEPEPAKLLLIPALMEQAGWVRKREWQELTDEEIKRYKPVCADLDSFRAGVKAVEAKLKEKNT
jgi:hypothetical protein